MRVTHPAPTQKTTEAYKTDSLTCKLPLVFSPLTSFNCTFSDATLGQPYRIQTSPSLEAASWTDFTNFTYTGPILFNDTSAVAGPRRFYRAITP